MFNSIISFSIRYRYLVLLLTLLSMVLGLSSYQHLRIDAVPDITNVQVQINTEAVGYSPLEAEQRITSPMEILLAGIPGLEYSRSLSRYGLSQVTLIFKDGTDIYFARQLVAQRLQEAVAHLPTGTVPSLGPITTGLGEIFMFTVENSIGTNHTRSLQELREIQDWIVKPQLRTIPGVIEINSIGGASKQYVVTPNLERLRGYDLTLDDLTIAIAENNSNIGAGFIEQNGEQLLIRVPAQLETIEDLLEIVVGIHESIPVLVKDLASLQIGSELRTGAATENGREVVLGTVFMLIGENGREVSGLVRERIKQIAPSLPEGVTIKPVYDRTNLVNSTIATVRKNLIEGALLVIVILFVMLGNFRAALITACVIPLSMLITIFGMSSCKLSANLMSLGALDFGLIVDGAVILVENCIRRLGLLQHQLGRLLNKEERLNVIYEASTEVRQATLFGELIIMVVYVPILTLTGIEGKMYHPMAFTVLLALGAAFILSLTFIPAAVAVFMTGEVKEKQGGLLSYLQNKYKELLDASLQKPVLAVAASIIIFLLSLIIFTRLGSEFVPSLDEGDIAMHALRIPGTSLEQSVEMQHKLEQAIKEIPEVSNVFAKIGTAEIANDPMPPSVADGFVMIKPRSEWKNPRKPKKVLVAELEELVAKIPGNNYEFTQPIQMRFNELIAGVRSDVAVKIFGDDSAILLEEGEKIRNLVARVEGASDVKLEQATGLPVIVVKPDREKIARFGITMTQLQAVVHTAFAGNQVSEFFEGDRKFPITVRLSELDRNNINSIRSLPIPLPIEETQHGHLIETINADLKPELSERSYVRLSDLAQIDIVEGPNQISREDGKRRVVVTANVRSRDLGSFVEEAQKTILTEVKLPAGYWLKWGGQYENLLSAQAKLTIVIPLVLLTVFLLIFITLHSIRDSLIVFVGVPFALSGGIFALWLRGIPFSISAAVGFIALSGVAVLNSLVLVSFIKKIILSGEDLIKAIVEGASSRLRPILMTALVASLGFIPMAISVGTGSEVQRPLATVVIGGIISSTLLTLVVVPCLLAIVYRQTNKNAN